jgi:hypothetical protein
MLRNPFFVEHMPIVMDYGIPDPRVAEDITPERMVVKRIAIDNPREIFVHPIQEVLAANIR